MAIFLLVQPVDVHESFEQTNRPMMFVSYSFLLLLASSKGWKVSEVIGREELRWLRTSL